MFYLIHAFYLALIPLHHLWSCLIELHRASSNLCQCTSRPIQTHHALSKLIRTHQNSSKLIRTHQNSSKLIKTHQNSSELIIHKGPPKFRLARPATNRYPNKPTEHSHSSKSRALSRTASADIFQYNTFFINYQ